MSLILFPRPNHLDEGPDHWSPATGLPEALSAASFAGTAPDGVDFREDVSTATENIKGAYTLKAGAEGIIISAGDNEGLWNALQTLKQLLRQIGTDGSLPELTIKDSPAFPIRGIMLDVSRTRVPTMETLRRLIDVWAELKINQLQLYIEHTFAYAGHETVWKEASPFTGGEIEEIDSWCRDRGIELVPNQNSFGHMERWLRHPEYHRYSEAPDGFEDPWGVYREFASTLDLSKPESMDLLHDLYDQFLPHFRSRTFNIGGDEPYDLGKGSNHEAYEAAGGGAFYLGFLRKVCDEVENRGYIPQFWADIILNYPELLENIPENAVVMNWGYEYDHPFAVETEKLAESGRKFQVCPGTSSWNALAGRWDNARENIRSAARWGQKNGASGFLITDWGDNGHKQQYVASLPGWFAGAAAAWNGETGADENVDQAIQLNIFEDSRGKEASWLLRLADLYRENPVRVHNMSFLMLPLLDHEFPYNRTQYKDIARAGMGRSREIAREADAILSRSDGDIWREQLAFTAKIMSFAADLAAPFYASGDYSIENLPAVLRESLADRLEELMAAYAGLWRKVCRTGGLNESLEGFTGLLELLRS